MVLFELVIKKMNALKIIFLSSLLLAWSCGQSNKVDSSSITFSELENGDIICRHGNGLFSDYFRKTSNREQLYSHVGIITIGNDTVYVIHSEASEFTGIGGVRKETIEVFLKGVDTWAVYRLDTIQSVRDSVVAVANRYWVKETAFDLDFDSTTDDKVYCTQLVSLSVNKAMHRSLILPTGVFRNKPYYTIDDTYLQNEMKLIKRS